MKDTEYRRAFFVFGSNRAGKHGAGAARCAALKHGAVYGVGEGITGYSYALPTKDFHLRTLPLDEIAVHVARFLSCAREWNKRRFNITEVGTGLAGYQARDIVPLFEAGYAMPNLYWPERWATRIGSTRVSFDAAGNPRG